MASFPSQLPRSPSLLPKVSLLLLSLFSCGGLFDADDSASPRYAAIFSFGDSLADTGNFLLSGALPFPSISRLPYGVTYFGRPTGRCSDGRLVVDFIAEAFGLPLLPPYLAQGQSFQQGVNFAFAGATALDTAFFEERGISDILWSNSSLSVQLAWFEKLKPSLCGTPGECNAFFNRSLFLVGEIGGNDYNYAFFKGKGLVEVRSYVPMVVQAIANATEKLIRLGATELMVPGNLPVGCSTLYLTLYGTPDKKDYDRRNGCLKQLNVFAKYHNALLQRALGKLRRRYQAARIIYADYYGAAIRFAHAPRHFGFVNGALRACCGGGGPYNFNVSAACGHPGSTVCSDPSSYVAWDGIHLTESAHRDIATGLLEGPYTTPPLLPSTTGIPTHSSGLF
ncbi:hypothetical protein Taro_005612 [Colocasia esculenta]|uniref:GDSL esterase/lipase n=1 Tax=Colocasia esculenta TaxID=4460 RepID=A0A843TQB5_COLES|nr:hypothetical protein [Colocasia esculenta]